MKNVTWNIRLRDNLAKQNNANKQEEKKGEKKQRKHFKEPPFPFSSNVQALSLQPLIISNHLRLKQHWNNGCRSASVARLVELQ